MIKITKSGWLYILVTILIGFAAVNTANNLIYILASALLSYMLISGMFGRWNLRNLAVNVVFPEEIFARTSTLVKIELHNQRRLLPAHLVRVSVCGGEVLFPYTDAAGSSRQAIEFEPSKRGPLAIDDIRISSAFPFNFFVRSLPLQESFATVVFPQPRRCTSHPQASSEPRHRRGEHAAGSRGDTGDLIAIRNYLPGDPIKYIHWKSTAKTGSLKTKEFSRSRSQEVMMVFERIPIRDLEERISCAAFIIIGLFRLHVAVGLSIAGDIYPPGTSLHHKRVLLQRLACHGQS